jgi:hypothetical protein
LSGWCRIFSAYFHTSQKYFVYYKKNGSIEILAYYQQVQKLLVEIKGINLFPVEPEAKHRKIPTMVQIILPLS